MRDNYYLLLELDPDENDWTVIEKRIRECQLEWSNIAQGGVGKKKREAGRRLALIKRIRADLKDDEKRERIRSRARELLAAQQDEKFTLIDEFITKYAEGNLEGSQEFVIKKFVQKAVEHVGKAIGGTVGPSDVESRLKQRGIRVATPAGMPGARRPKTLLDNEAKAIQGFLESLGKKDLYDYLNMNRSVPSEALRSQAKSAYGDAHGTGKTDSETTARKRLAGYCNKLFGDEASRKRYDNTLDIQALGRLDAHLDLAGVDGRLTRTEVEKVMKEAVTLGIDQGMARWYIHDYADKRRLTIPSTMAREQRERLGRLEVERSVPSNLRVVIEGGTARLSWKGARWHPELAYVVVRRESRAPRHSNDGTMIAREVTADFYDDAGLPPGTPWHYGVFAVQAGVTSKRAATSGPHIYAATPADVVASGTDRQVVVRWKPPRGCLGVEVWRKPGSPPSRRGEGTRVTASRKSATDHGLTNGRRYGYLVLASYRDQGRGGRVWSSAVKVEATPVRPPEPIDDLRVERTGRDVILRWTPPGNGRVEIRRSKRIPGVSRGDFISAARADRLGDLVEPTGAGEARTKLPGGQDRVFFVPATFVAATGVVGIIGELEAGGQGARVTYRVVTKRNWITRRVTGVRIDLRTQDDIGSLNGVVAVLNETKLPIHSTDGVTVAPRSRIEFQDGRATLALPASVKAGYVKLFFEDDETTNGVRLVSPARNRLRVGSGRGG